MRAILILLIIIGTVLSMCPVNTHGMARDLIESAPERIRSMTEQIVDLEKDISNSESLGQKIVLKRTLIQKLAMLAIEHSYAGHQSDNLFVLTRVDSLYRELEELGQLNDSLYADYFRHGDFLANIGFGEAIRSSWFLRKPEPDYPRAIGCFTRAIESPDLALRQRAEAEIAKIKTPLISVGNLLFSGDDLFLFVAVRNIKRVSIEVTCRNPEVKLLRAWTEELKGIDDHEVQKLFFRVKDIPLCALLDVTATADEGLISTLSNLEPGNPAKAELPFRPAYQQLNQLVPGVLRIDMITEGYPIKGNHSMNQACSLCHIPHAAGE
jgi:hypothetical protein